MVKLTFFMKLVLRGSAHHPNERLRLFANSHDDNRLHFAFFMRVIFRML